MLSFTTPQRGTGSSAQLGRREFLRVGGLALGGLTLPGLLSSPVQAAVQAGLASGKSVIFLFMHGGPSQIETFDPKMTAPLGVRSVTGEIATKLPGVTFGSTFSKLAGLADKFSVVRSFVTGDGNHDIKPVVGRATNGANLGTLYSRVVGANHALTGMPSSAVLYPQSVDATTGPAINNFGKLESTGTLGSGFSPFIPGAGGNLQRDMQLTLPQDRLGDRRALLAGLDRLRWNLEANAKWDGLDKIREQAFETILGGVAGAFDLSQEDPQIVGRYDTAPHMRPDQISKKWNNYNHYVDHGKSLGKLLLLARRLCERGCGLVTVTTSFVWDMHSDANNAGVEEGMRYIGLPFDHAVSALIEDLEARGLSEKIMLVCCGEMGRSPRVNSTGGRDHWGALAPLLIYGGGTKAGQVLGQSNRQAAEPSSDPITINDLVATILNSLLDVGAMRLVTGVPQEILRAATDGRVIPGLV